MPLGHEAFTVPIRGAGRVIALRDECGSPAAAGRDVGASRRVCVRPGPRTRGKAMARHEELARRVSIQVYFADPHRPWQRPSNGNANGLIGDTCPRTCTRPASPRRK